MNMAHAADSSEPHCPSQVSTTGAPDTEHVRYSYHRLSLQYNTMYPILSVAVQVAHIAYSNAEQISQDHMPQFLVSPCTGVPKTAASPRHTFPVRPIRTKRVPHQAAVSYKRSHGFDRDPLFDAVRKKRSVRTRG
jgi:hypothetical protein